MIEPSMCGGNAAFLSNYFVSLACSACIDVPVVSVVDDFTDVVVCHVKASPACTTLPLTTSMKQCVVSRTYRQWPVPCMARNVSIASLRL